MKKVETFKSVILFLVAAMMIVSLTACGTTGNDTKIDSSAAVSEDVEQSKAFPKFQGTDFDGNAVDETMFSKNTVTVLNFWFNGCSACVDEMPGLEKLNQMLQEKGAALVGVNVEAGGDEKALEEAKKILSERGATYKNIMLKEGEEINAYLEGIQGFPTTVLVNRDGHIVGAPILGSIDDEKRMANILKMVEDVAAGKEVSSDGEKTESDIINDLVEEENNIFTAHMDIWDKVLDNIPHDEASQMSQDEYVSFLKKQIDKMKDSFSKDELKMLNDDIQKIEEIEKKIQELEDAK